MKNMDLSCTGNEIENKSEILFFNADFQKGICIFPDAVTLRALYDIAIPSIVNWISSVS